MAHNVVVYTRPTCTFCQQVRDILGAAGVDFEEVEVTSPAQMERLFRQYDARSLPMVVANGVFVGGFTEIIQLHAEERLSSLAQVPSAKSP